MQVTILGVPPNGTVVQIDKGTAITLNSVVSAGTGNSIIQSYVNGVVTLKSLIATAPLAITSNANDLTFTVDFSGLAAVYVPLTRTIGTTAPLTGGGALSSNLTLAIPAATNLVNGYLTSADWIIFNAKQGALGYTPVNQTRTLTAGAGLAGGGDLGADRTFDVNVDNSTIEINSDTLRLKDGGITAAKLAVGVFVQSPDAVQLYTKVLTIGDWNMDLNTATTVTHGLANYKKIRAINVIIRDDTDAIYTDINTSDTTGATNVGTNGVDSTLIGLVRKTGGIYDTTAYDSTGFNRGWITILYEA